MVGLLKVIENDTVRQLGLHTTSWRHDASRNSPHCMLRTRGRQITTNVVSESGLFCILKRRNDFEARRFAALTFRLVGRAASVISRFMNADQTERRLVSVIGIHDTSPVDCCWQCYKQISSLTRSDRLDSSTTAWLLALPLSLCTSRVDVPVSHAHLFVVDAARLVCGPGQGLCNGLVSVRPSVPSIDRGGFAAGRPAGRRYRSSAAGSGHPGGRWKRGNGKRGTNFTRVEKAWPPSMEREIDKYKCIMYR